MPSLGSNGRRVAIVAGLRTPFARAGTVLKSLSAIELGRLCVAELIQRTGIDGNDVDLLVFVRVRAFVRLKTARRGVYEIFRISPRPS